MASNTALADAIGSVSTQMFSDKQTQMTTSQTTFEQWTQADGNSISSLILAKLNSEPHVTNIQTEFSQNAVYQGGVEPSPNNRFSVSYSTTSLGLTEEEHTLMTSMDSLAKKNKVAELLSDEFATGNIKVPKLDYIVSTRELRITLLKFQTVSSS